MAVGGKGTILTSEDGKTWQQRYFDSTITFNSVTWAGNQLIAAGSFFYLNPPGPAVGGPVIMTSPDGIIWKVRHPDLFYPTEVKWDGKQIIAVGDKYGVSLEGIAWDAKDIGQIIRPGHGYTLHSVAWSGSTYVVIGWAGNEGAAIFTSDNGGGTWARNASDARSLNHSLIWAGSQFVLAGAEYIYTSPNGYSWSKQSASPSYLKTVIWSGDQLLAVGASGDIFYSPDGVTWSNSRADTHSSAEPTLLSVISSDTQYVAIGERGAILTASHEPVVAIEKRTSKQEKLSIHLSANRIFIHLDVPIQGAVHVSLYSVAGERILATTVYPTNSELSVPFPILKSGVYLVEVQTTTSKIIRPISFVQ